SNDGLQLNGTDDVEPSAEQPKLRMGAGSRLMFFILFGLGACVILCALSVGGSAYVVYRSTQPAVDASRTFLEALGDRDYALAYGYLSPTLRSEFETQESFAQSMQDRGIIPVEVETFWGRSIADNEASMRTDVIYETGVEQVATVNLRWNPSVELWEITGFSFESPDAVE
ncbi:MAG: hypothetical protein AAF787_15915, partial [Chloroflexota bacterium]